MQQTQQARSTATKHHRYRTWLSVATKPIISRVHASSLAMAGLALIFSLAPAIQSTNQCSPPLRGRSRAHKPPAGCGPAEARNEHGISAAVNRSVPGRDCDWNPRENFRRRRRAPAGLPAGPPRMGHRQLWPLAAYHVAVVARPYTRVQIQRIAAEKVEQKRETIEEPLAVPSQQVSPGLASNAGHPSPSSPPARAPPCPHHHHYLIGRSTFLPPPLLRARRLLADPDGLHPAVPRRPASSSGPTKRGGLLLGRYELGRVLGHGTFAKVYHARHADTGETVAIKVLDKEKALRNGLVPHIKREIAILRRVRHPNIVRLFEVMATKSKIYFVMEFVRGGELFARVAKGRLKEDIARRYFQQLISAVGFCHARGVFHRDLKPENLLVDEHGDLKVSDFGLSAVADQFHPDGLLHTFCGTPSYVAPEVLGRRGYDGAKVDIWSCGVILFVLMAGYLPFHDQNLMAMYRKIYRGEFRCPRWFSKDLTSLLNRLLDTNPETRITVAQIMESRWFQKGFRPVRFYVENDQVHSLAEDENEVPELGPSEPLPQPPQPQQEDDGDDSGILPSHIVIGREKTTHWISYTAMRFVSAQPMQTIIRKLEEIAKVKSFAIRRKDWRVSLEGTRESEKGPLTIGAEVFELTSSLVVVEVKMKAGDREEYEDFCERELKPGMQHLVHHTASVPDIPSDTE
ncbi:hypothetical protein HU200_023977 [Digitaria exilis]|uniref:non-specific serine/threonine protein kinase n=1 Tax=Digitaria exilis TaxID=1010633 RepID=A0A835C0U8_9POAL|nr:hypothetical protein HU200_023977 [Digitaria exilis]